MQSKMVPSISTLVESLPASPKLALVVAFELLGKGIQYFYLVVPTLWNSVELFLYFWSVELRVVR